MTVRTRFAPSPTGYMHVGGVRTALFAWLVARQNKGQFILRIEDTDKVREVPGSIEHIMESLRWLGLEWDEGPDKDGQFGPYQQSKRLDIYKEWAGKLLEQGRAYADPRTPDELNVLRDDAKAKKKPFLIREYPIDNPPVWKPGIPLRFKAKAKNDLWHDAITEYWHDEVMGDIGYTPQALDDFIILKSDGFPTYNFAHIIDDHLMQVSHVIRSQEFIASVPKYLNLYDALGFERPVLATLPYVMGPDGKKKLSKRDGAKDVLDYAKEGYLPEAMLNFLATLGWNDGTEQEIFSANELIQKFSLDRVQKGGARFDEQRLKWINGSHIRALDIDTIYTRCQDPAPFRSTLQSDHLLLESGKGTGHSFWPEEAKDYDEAYKKAVLKIVQDRLKYLAELPELTKFFFVDLPVNPELISDHKQLSKLSKEDLKNLLEKAKAELEQSDFSLEDLTKRLNGLLETAGQKPVVLFSLIRIAITQAPASPGLADTLAVLGKDRSISRIQTQLHALS